MIVSAKKLCPAMPQRAQIVALVALILLSTTHLMYSKHSLVVEIRLRVSSEPGESLGVRPEVSVTAQPGLPATILTIHPHLTPCLAGWG